MARKYQWMGIIALFLVVLLLSDSMLVKAMESGVIIGDGISEDVEAYEIDENEIWAQIDRNELRSLVDVEELRNSIDTRELLEKIDKTAIEENISDINLLDSLNSETLLDDYNGKKESGELDDFIKDVIESEDFDEDFILNHPIDIPNVTVPVIQGQSPFDYILDPQGLISQTDASRYGGGIVKENASVLFKNTDGEYLFSDYSDKLTITNKSNIPLQVTISAKIEDDGDISMADSISDLEGVNPSMFMALVDSEGILGVLNSNGSSEISIILKAAPEGTYIYKLNEETGEYDYELADKKAAVNENIKIEQSQEELVTDADDKVKIDGDENASDAKADKNDEDAGNVTDDVKGNEDTDNSKENSKDEENNDSSNEDRIENEEIVVETPIYYAENDVESSRQPITMLVKTQSPSGNEASSSKTDAYGFDSFSFGLYASCNTEADWRNVRTLPRVVVTWKTEPVLTDWDKINAELEEYDKVKFEAYKQVVLGELREAEVERLVQEELNDLIEEKLEELIEAKVDILAKEKFDELVLDAIVVQSGSEPPSKENEKTEEILIIQDHEDPVEDSPADAENSFDEEDIQEGE